MIAIGAKYCPQHNHEAASWSKDLKSTSRFRLGSFSLTASPKGAVRSAFDGRLPDQQPQRRNAPTRGSDRLWGFHSALSHRPNVPSSTQAISAARLIDSPNRLRWASSFSPRVSVSDQGSYPRYWMIAGYWWTYGARSSRSHHIQVFGSTPTTVAASTIRWSSVRRRKASRWPRLASGSRIDSCRCTLSSAEVRLAKGQHGHAAAASAAGAGGRAARPRAASATIRTASRGRCSTAST